MEDLVVYGLGEFGQLLGAFALRAGLRVTPILRGMHPRDVLSPLPHSVPVLVAVGEDALDDALSALPLSHRGQLIFLQNELWPRTWERHGLSPSVVVPWLLKKKNTPLLIAGPTPVFGPQSALIGRLLSAGQIPHIILASEGELRRALVEKYVFILTINALGVWRDATLAELLRAAPDMVDKLAREASQLGAVLADIAADEERCVAQTLVAMHALGTIPARGRTARARVERAAGLAQTLRLSLPTLEALVEGRDAAREPPSPS